ncbi:MAG: sulfatase modifying factor 1, partial [Flavobacteriales bacterium]
MTLKTKRIFWIGAAIVISVIGFLYYFTLAKVELINEKNSKGSNPDTTPKFELTIENINNKPDESNEGMVWIPGGEFSMGTNIEDESLCSIKGVTSDARPIHRVYVDGFW